MSQVPFVVYGRVKKDGQLQPGVSVTVRNVTKNQQATVQTNNVGEYAVDLGDTTKYSSGYSNGDSVEVSALGVSRSFTVNTSKWGEEVNIGLWEIFIEFGIIVDASYEISVTYVLEIAFTVNVSAVLASETTYNIRPTVQIKTYADFSVETVEVVTERVPGVDPNDVRDVLNLSASDIPDDKIYKMIRRAAVTVALELNKEIDFSKCTEEEQEAITLLAAIYAICYLTGGSAVGLNFSLGDKSVSVLKDAPPLSVLQSEFQRLIDRMKERQKEEEEKDFYVGLA